MVSDQEIVNGVESLLRQSDPNAVKSINGVIQQLEAKLGLDLSHKTTFIRDQIDLLLRSNPQKEHFAPQHHRQFQNNHPPLIPPAHFQPPHHHQVLEFQCAAPPPKPDASAQMPVPEVPKESTPTGTKRRGGPGGLNKVCGVSPELQAIVGEPEMPRTQIVKELWAYIRKNNLQDPSNKRKIICNDELRLVFETDCTDMFKMNKLLAKHITALEPTKNSGADPKRLKAADVAPKTEYTEDTLYTVVKAADVTPKTEYTEDTLYTLVISDALAKFFGTGEREMLQSEAVRRVWDYIKVNKLEDPLNSMVIQCDTKLQELFGCNNFSAMGISEMLVDHLFTRS